MKFVLLVEGHTESTAAVRDFLRSWLDPQLSSRAGIQTVRFDGWADFHREAAKKARMHLYGPGAGDLLGVAGLLDLYGPTFYPDGVTTAQQRREWARKQFEDEVNDPRFRMFLAVHEVEAWLLSEPSIFPAGVGRALQGSAGEPEAIDFDEPPAKLLERLYREKLKRRYKKVTDGSELFKKLQPDVAYNKCPALKELLDWMLERAKAGGL